MTKNKIKSVWHGVFLLTTRALSSLITTRILTGTPVIILILSMIMFCFGQKVITFATLFALYALMLHKSIHEGLNSKIQTTVW